MTKSLIIPVAGKSSRYPGMRPKWLLTMPDGKLMLEKSIELFDISKFSKIVVVALKEHVDRYTSTKVLSSILKKAFSKKVILIQLENETSCQAETVLYGIVKSKVKGGFIIKDVDNIFSQKIDKINKNQITTINSKKIDLLDAKSKSYIDFNKMGKVTNIVEKKVISDYFCSGAYEFRSTKDFIFHANKCLKISKNVFISDVIYSMLLDNHYFSYIEGSDYIDWGTLREFRNFHKKHYTIFCDFDGCLVENSAKFSKKPWIIKPIKKNIECIQKLQKLIKVELIITTSRSSAEKKKISNFLRMNNIKFKIIITDLMHSKRILINDFANSNPYPSSIAVNISRNNIELSSVLESIIYNT